VIRHGRGQDSALVVVYQSVVGGRWEREFVVRRVEYWDRPRPCVERVSILLLVAASRFHIGVASNMRKSIYSSTNRTIEYGERDTYGVAFS